MHTVKLWSLLHASNLNSLCSVWSCTTDGLDKGSSSSVTRRFLGAFALTHFVLRGFDHHGAGMNLLVIELAICGDAVDCKALLDLLDTALVATTTGS